MRGSSPRKGLMGKPMSGRRPGFDAPWLGATALCHARQLALLRGGRAASQHLAAGGLGGGGLGLRLGREGGGGAP